MTSKKAMPAVNTKGINRLLNDGYTKRELCSVFVLSRPFLDKLIAEQARPAHPGIVYFINWKVKGLLERKQA